MGQAIPEPPDVDERTETWLWLYGFASRGRPYEQGCPLPIPPLDVLSLAGQLGVAAQPDEALMVIGEMDEAWLSIHAK